MKSKWKRIQIIAAIAAAVFLLYGTSLHLRRDSSAEAPAVFSQPSHKSAVTAVVTKPALPLPATSTLAVVADREAPFAERLRPLVDGSHSLIRAPQDLALLRAVLSDPAEGDTLRNEAANHLFRAGDADLAQDLITVVQDDRNRDRFRSFAVQHLGLLWQREGYQNGSPVHQSLRACLDDSYRALQRNALQALARGGDARARAQVEVWLEDPATSDTLDLCARLVADHDWRDLLPHLRARTDHPDMTIRIAILGALARLGDEFSRDAFAVAAQARHPALAATGRRGLAALANNAK